MAQNPVRYMSTDWFGTVHDSMIFDTVEQEVKQAAYMGIQVFEALPAEINKIWGIDFNLPLTGEATWGPSYGKQIHKLKHKGGQWILQTK